MPIELLVLICLLVGVLPAWAVGNYLNAAALPVVGGTLPEFSLALWHGINTPLVMSFIAMIAGIALYLMLRQLRSQGRAEDAPIASRFNGQRIFEGVMARITNMARHLRRLLGTRRSSPWPILMWNALSATGTRWPASSKVWASR